MSPQPSRRSMVHALFSALTRKAPGQANQPIQPPLRPAPGDRDAWHTYWKAQGQPWRTEPEIDTQRQQMLERCRVITLDIERGIYPFSGMKLNRADIEWLLATHENGRGPIDWSEEHQRGRLGLDLRGADLRQIDLRKLPLARLRGGLDSDEWLEATEQQLTMAAVLMEGASLRWAHLEGAHLRFAHLDGADLRFAYLERAHLRGASLKRVDLRDAYLETTRLENVFWGDEQRIGPRLADVKWGNGNLSVVKWSQIDILGDEYEARQKKHDGKMKGKAVHLKEFEQAVRANRQLAVTLQAQGLNEDASHFAYRAQVLQKHVFWFQMAQHGITLKQRTRALEAWLLSWFLFLLSGYGYKPIRSFLAYLFVISLFALTYFALGATARGPHHLEWYEAIVVSMTAFHGRGFFADQFHPGDPQAFVAAFEAFVGLIIEVTFIATLTRRLFGQ